ncbi:MAG: flagellin [Lachnospiraceae bacterium]|nr:flagellin [Lachnospiraceae bacterium]
MNLDREHAASTQDGKAAMPYELENEDAVIPVSAQGVTDACFTQINDLYGVLDKSNVKMDKTGITHTGAGFWWEASANAGSAINLGSVKYGPIELKKVPYEMKVESKDNIIISEETTKTTTEKVYKPKYLDIQAGANAFQLVPIRTWNLSAENLKCRVPTELSAYNAQDSLVHLDRVIDKITSIRVYYGAMTNRMEHAYLNADNTAENLTSSESRIRDADLADEMVVYSKNAIVQQAGQSMLAQANRNAQGIVALLQ